MRNKKVVEIKSFNNFNNTENVLVKKFYNYLPNKKLNNSHGIENAKFYKNLTNRKEEELKIAQAGVTKIEGLSYFKQYFSDEKYTAYRLLIYGDDKKIYINQLLDDTYELYWLYELKFETKPIVYTYKKDDLDAAVLASKDKVIVWRTDWSPYEVKDTPVITSMCINEEVMFCTIVDPAYKIWHTNILDPEVIGHIQSKSGYLSLEDDLGDAKKVITFNETVFVFRDYGITKISNYRTMYSTSQIYRSNTKIYPNTVGVCGNVILFMTKDGLYSFNGVKVDKININLLNDIEIENDGAVASSLGEKYYLALRLNFNDEETANEENLINNVLVIVDTCDYSFEIIRGVDINTLLPLKTEVFEKMLVTFNNGPVNKIGQIVDSATNFTVPLSKFWASANLVNNRNTKMFTSLTVEADSDIKFRLIYDDSKLDLITKKQGITTFNFKICCKDIKLEISSTNSSAEVNYVALNYYET